MIFRRYGYEWHSNNVFRRLRENEETNAKLRNIVHLRDKQIDDFVCIFQKIGIDRDVINKIDQKTINVFQDFSIDLEDVLKYRIEFECFK